MGNDFIRWQMKKVGWDSNGKEGIELAEKQFQFLEWLQDLYNHNCLKGKFYTKNIIKELWDEIRQYPDPLQKMGNGYQKMYQIFSVSISGDEYVRYLNGRQ